MTNPPPDISSPLFWSSRYQEGTTGWDLGAPAPNLQALIHEHLPKGGRILVPGAGKGHDVVAFAESGYQVTGLDFAPEAAQAAASLALQKGVAIDWVTGDLFAERPEWTEAFDAWAELTCFCAIPLLRRTDYVARAAQYLKPGGIVAAVFFVGLPAGGPPYDTNPEEIRSLFIGPFDILFLRPSQLSVPSRQGQEWEGVFRRK